MIIKVSLGLVVVLFFSISYYFFRIQGYKSNADQLHLITNKFETDYVIGNGEEITYVAIGDSTAYGVGVADLKSTLPYGIAQALSSSGKKVHVINLAKSGARIQEVVDIQFKKAKTLRPDVLSVSVGGNDATHLTSFSAFKDSAQSLVNQSSKLGIKVVIASSPDMKVVPAIPPILNLIAGYWSSRQSEIMKSLVMDAGLTYADIYSNAKLDDRKYYASDSFHPNKAGYNRWLPEYTKGL